MRTVVLGSPPVELERLIARRRALGLDTHDEVWKGEYHMAPAASGSHGYLLDQVVAFLRPLAMAAGLWSTGPFNLGDPDDFRVPDWGYHRRRPTFTWFETAALVVEVESPDDESWERLGFYAQHAVEEVLIVSGDRRSVTWLRLDSGRYVEAEHGNLLGSESSRLAVELDWPVDESPTVDTSGGR
jgi:hypothetical protein